MRRFALLIAVAGTLGLSAAGCASRNTPTTAVVPPAPAAAEPVQTAEPAKAATQPVPAAPERTNPAKAEREPAAVEGGVATPAASERIAATEAGAHQSLAQTLQQAQTSAAQGRLDEANRAYLRMIDAPDVSRETLAAAGTGLYRTGNFSSALRAFQKLGAISRGEEDLRYYYAVSLYETGRYAEARRQLRCALPYLEVTDSMARYREKIEHSLSPESEIRMIGF